jgi:ABC-type metal ion transport system, permease component
MATDLGINFSIVGGRLERYRDHVLGYLIINVKGEDYSPVVEYLKSNNLYWEIVQDGQHPAESAHILDIMVTRMPGPTIDTLYMVSVSTMLSLFFGMILAMVMVLTGPKGLLPTASVYLVLDFTVNTLRSFPFIILIIAMIPITRWVVGTSIGSSATIVPLTVAAAPFVARIMEVSLLEVDAGVIEAAKSFGASHFQIITRVMLKEAMPSIALNVAVVAINLVGYSAMAGAVGGEAWGHRDYVWYYRYEVATMVAAIIILIVMVQLIQMLGNFLLPP